SCPALNPSPEMVAWLPASIGCWRVAPEKETSAAATRSTSPNGVCAAAGIAATMSEPAASRARRALERRSIGFIVFSCRMQRLEWRTKRPSLKIDPVGALVWYGEEPLVYFRQRRFRLELAETVRMDPLRERLDGDDVERRIDEVMREAVSTALPNSGELRDTASSRDFRQRGLALRLVIARAENQPARFLQVRSASGYVHVRITRNDVLQVQLAERLLDRVAADVVAADEGQIVADVAASRRIAAIGTHAGMGFDEYRRPVLFRQVRDGLLDPRHPLGAKGNEAFGLLFAPRQPPEDAQARLKVFERLDEKVDEHDADAGGFELLHLRLGHAALQ